MPRGGQFICCALAGLALLCGCDLGGGSKQQSAKSSGPPPDRNLAREFKLPNYDDQNRLTSVIYGQQAKFDPAKPDIEIIGARVETYDDEGRTNMVIRAPNCIFNRDDRRAHSSGPIEAQSTDGRLSIAGVGFEWSQATGELNISNRVETLIKGTKLFSQKP